MLQPCEADQIHIIAQGIISQGKPVDVIIGVAAVHPGAEDDLLLIIIRIQIQGFRGPHPVVVKPAGHDQRRHPALPEAVLPASPLPQLVTVHMGDPFAQEGYVIPQGFRRQLFQGTDTQHFIPVVPHHFLRVHALSGYGKCPRQHAGIEAPAPSRHIHKGTSGADAAEHGLQMRIAAGRSRPLDISQVRPSGHGRIPVAPGLSGDPIQRVVPVLHLIVHGQPFAFAVLPAPDILDHHAEASLYEAVIRLCVF